MNKNETELRRELVEFGTKAFVSGFVTETEGNLSLRVSEDRILVTPTHVPYNSRTMKDLVLLDSQGNIISGKRKPTTEFRIHLSVYKNRSDVGAIIHAHPLYCTILAVMGQPLKPVLDEMIPYLGGTIEVTGFAPFGSEKIADNVVHSLGEKAGVLIANHGSLSVGKNMSRAYQTTKYMEKYAQIYLSALTFGKARILSEKRQKEELPLYKIFKDLDY